MDTTGPRIKKQLVGGECPWCYGIGSSHSPECRVMRQSSLQTQRSKTEQLRGEMYATAGQMLNPFSPENWNITEQGRVYRTKEEPKDERTEVQKRFDALAEEFGSE